MAAFDWFSMAVFASVRYWFGVAASGFEAFSRLTSCGKSVAGGKLASVALR